MQQVEHRGASLHGLVPHVQRGGVKHGVAFNPKRDEPAAEPRALPGIQPPGIRVVFGRERVVARGIGGGVSVGGHPEAAGGGATAAARRSFGLSWGRGLAGRGHIVVRGMIHVGGRPGADGGGASAATRRPNRSW